MSRRLITVLALTSALAAATYVPREAGATGVPRVLRPGTRPWQLLLGSGPAWTFGGAAVRTTTRLTQEFAGHFRGDASGPALGVIASEEFRGDYFEFAIAPKFTLDLQPRRDLGLYIAPNLALGYRLLSEKFSGWGWRAPFRVNHHGATLQIGVALKLMLDDRWLLWFQPLHIDLSVVPPRASCIDTSHVPCSTKFVPRLALVLGAGVSF